VVLLDVKTGRRFRLPSVRIESTPIIAPDGSAVVFVSNRKGKFDLWIQQLRDAGPVGSPRQLTDHPGSVATPRFSPGGERIAYHRVVNGRRDIWTLSLPDGQPIQFTDHAAMDVNPSFSPDGSKLAFISDRSGRYHIWVASIADGERVGEPFMVTDGNQQDHFPDWSPDGASIAFVRGGEVWVTAALPKSFPRQLTEGAQASIVRWEKSGHTLLVS
jgi:TolB protein